MIRAVPTRLTLIAIAAVIAVGGWFALATSSAPSADAHPLGNFTVNRYARLELYSDAVLVRYVVDMAEIPAFQEIETIDVDGDGEISESESTAYLESRAPDLRDGLTVTVDGEATDLDLLTSDISYPKGQAGLDTLRIALWLRAGTPPAASLDFSDNNYPGRIGWREVIAHPAPGASLLHSTAPTTDLSAELTAYPDDLLSSPPGLSSVSLSYDASHASPAPGADALGASATITPALAPERSGAGFASLIDTQDLTPFVVILALLAALAFGAVHALEPGHGKTLVAAYFVGIKGTARQAVALGLIIAATHTIGVLAIGLITLFGSRYFLPEDLYPWLSLAAGVMVLALGLRLVLARVSGLGLLHRIAHNFGHSHGHDHHHTQLPPTDGAPPWRSLIALGLADGLVPSPSTLVVLLAAVSLDRIGLGIALVIAFSVGLAAVLTLVSLALVYARRLADWFAHRRTRAGATGPFARLAALAGNQTLFANYLPIAGALVLTAAGATLTLRALPALNIIF